MGGVSTGASTGAVAGIEKWMSEMGPGRHILLRASYNGVEVVLKGFFMGEISQRTGLERELAILSTLRNDCVICPRAVVEDFDMLESTSYVQKVAVFVEYLYYKGSHTSPAILTLPCAVLLCPARSYPAFLPALLHSALSTLLPFPYPHYLQYPPIPVPLSYTSTPSHNSRAPLSSYPPSMSSYPSLLSLYTPPVPLPSV